MTRKHLNKGRSKNHQRYEERNGPQRNANTYGTLRPIQNNENAKLFEERKESNARNMVGNFMNQYGNAEPIYRELKRRRVGRRLGGSGISKNDTSSLEFDIENGKNNRSLNGVTSQFGTRPRSRGNSPRSKNRYVVESAANKTQKLSRIDEANDEANDEAETNKANDEAETNKANAEAETRLGNTFGKALGHFNQNNREQSKSPNRSQYIDPKEESTGPTFSRVMEAAPLRSKDAYVDSEIETSIKELLQITNSTQFFEQIKQDATRYKIEHMNYIDQIIEQVKSNKEVNKYNILYLLVMSVIQYINEVDNKSELNPSEVDVENFVLSHVEQKKIIRFKDIIKDITNLEATQQSKHSKNGHIEIVYEKTRELLTQMLDSLIDTNNKKGGSRRRKRTKTKKLM